MKRMVNAVFAVLGLIFFGLAVAGAVLPVLPTVPFLLAAAFCFARGSKRFNKWFRETKLYKANLENYVRHKALTIREKRRILILMTVMIGVAGIFMDRLWLRVLLAAVLVVHYWLFLCHIPTMPEEASGTFSEEKEEKCDDGK